MKHSSFTKQLLRDAGITCPYTSCSTYLGKIMGGITAAAPSPGLVSQLRSPQLCSGPRQGKNKAEKEPSRLPLSTHSTHGQGWSPPAPAAAVGSGPLSKPPSHCSPSQPQQLRQFRAFHISGPVSVFNYSYKTAVI